MKGHEHTGTQLKVSASDGTWAPQSTGVYLQIFKYLNEHIIWDH
jgi:hypothetical protein